MNHLMSLLGGILVWGLWLTGYRALALKENPLCILLESDAQHHPLRTFPAKYFCHGAEQFVCWRSETIDDASAYSGAYGGGIDVADNSPIGSLGPIIVGPDYTEPTTWWVCEGDRQRREFQANVSIECGTHFAFQVDSDDAFPDCGQPFNPMASTGSGNHAGVISPAKSRSTRGLEHGTNRADQSATRSGTTWEGSRALATESDLFVRTVHGQQCNERWTLWPAMQESAMAGGNVLLYQIFPSVGNLFLTLTHMVKVSLLLEVALVLDCQRFPGFRVAFDPAEISWDVDPAIVMEKATEVSQGIDSTGLHALKFKDGALILSDSRLLLLASKLDILEASIAETAAAVEAAGFRWLRRMVPPVVNNSPPPDSCAWNFLLRRSSAMMKSMVAHDPWGTTESASGGGFRPTKYVAWHIRTSDGESEKSFKADVHRYVFHQEHSTTVFRLFLAATDSAEDECNPRFPGDGHDAPIYVSSNSKVMARNCSTSSTERGVLSGFLDLGITEDDSHTEFSKNPNITAINAFVDFLYLMDADIIVRSRSSFSGSVVAVKGMECRRALLGKAIPVSGIYFCLSADC